MNILENATLDSISLLDGQTVLFMLDLRKNPSLTVENVREALEDYADRYPTVHGWQTQFVGSQLSIIVTGQVNLGAINNFM